MRSTTQARTDAPASATSLYPRATLRGLILGLALFIYTWLGAQTRMPPALLPTQGALLLLLGGWWVWKAARGQRLACSPLALPIVALLGAATLATLFSIDRRVSFEGLLAHTALVLLFFLLCDLLLAGWSAQTFVRALLLLASLLLAQGLLAAAQWHWGWYNARVPEYPLFLLSYRLFDVAGHPNALAALLNMALPFAILALARAPTRAARAGWALWLVAFDSVLFLTRSRGGWVATGVVVAMMVCWLIAEQHARWRIAGTTLAFVALFALLAATSAWASPSEYTTNAGGFSAARSTFWGIAWRDFLAHPLTGSGPLTYGRVYASQVGAVRDWLAVHAHNLYLDTLAQQGLLGLAALGWIIFRFGFLIFDFENRKSKIQNEMLLCVCAALAGCLTHSLFDVVTALPTNALLVVLLSALGLHAAGALRPAERGMSRWTLAALAAPLLLWAVLVRQNAGQASLVQAIVDGEQGEWVAAARALDAATASDPALDFYNSQRGYAYGMLATEQAQNGDAGTRAQALKSYATALAEEPAYAPNLLNAAALLELNGEPQLAERALEAALPVGHDWALPALLLAERRSAQGQQAEVDALYTRAFAAEPHAPAMAACRRSQACRAVAARQPAPDDPVAQAHRAAQALLAQGQPVQALEALQQAPLGSANPQPWLDRADAHLALGQLPQARYSLRVADALGATRPATFAHAARSLATLYTARGLNEEAITVLERAAALRGGGQAYSFFVFRRAGLPGLLLPPMDLLQRTEDDLAVYRKLADLYTAQGRSADAARVRERAEALAGLLGVQ